MRLSKQHQALVKEAKKLGYSIIRERSLWVTDKLDGSWKTIDKQVMPLNNQDDVVSCSVVKDDITIADELTLDECFDKLKKVVKEKASI